MTELKTLNDLQILIKEAAKKQNELLNDPNKEYGSPAVVAFNNLFWSIQEAYIIIDKGLKGEYFD